jgi:hypothetical protein
MPGVKNFTDLLMWQRARQWSKRIFEATCREPFHGDRRLVEQINDSSESGAQTWLPTMNGCSRC